MILTGYLTKDFAGKRKGQKVSLHYSTYNRLQKRELITDKKQNKE